MEIIVTREYLISLLQAWKEGKITASEISSTASKLLWDIKVLDEENGDDYSVTAEVVDLLDSLDVNLITEEDIDAYIEFLHTPIGEYEQGCHKLWEKHKSKINYKERKERLKNVEPYLKIYGEGNH